MKLKKLRLTRRLINIWSVLCVFVFIASCSTAKITYNSLDIIIPWFLDDYVTFNETQEHQIAAMLSQHLEWHRNTQLPGYVELLGEIQQDIQADVSNQQLLGYYTSSQKLWQTMVIQFIPDIATVLATLDDDQVKELFDSMEYHHEEMKSKYVDLTPDEMHEGRIDRMKDRFERWLDELTPQQEKAINVWSHELKPINEYWHKNRLQWNNQFKLNLEQRNKPTQFYTNLRRLFIDYDSLRSSAYVSALNYNQEKTINLIIDIQHQISDEQRNYLVAEIEDIKQDLVDLNKS